MPENVQQLELPVKPRRERHSHSIESDYWSPGGQIHYSQGWAWGVTSYLQPVCLGREVDTLDALEHNLSTGHDGIDNILRMDINERGKEHHVTVKRRRK